MTEWDMQLQIEAEAVAILRRAFFANIDREGQTLDAERVGADRSSIIKSARKVGYIWRTRSKPRLKLRAAAPQPEPRNPGPKARDNSVQLSPQQVMDRLRRGMNPRQRRVYERALDAGVKPVYAIRDALAVQQ